MPCSFALFLIDGYAAVTTKLKRLRVRQGWIPIL